VEEAKKNTKKKRDRREEGGERPKNQWREGRRHRDKTQKTDANKE
jgi:hypothetical protein